MKKDFQKILGWHGTTIVHGSAFTCANCGALTAPKEGFRSTISQGVCPNISLCPQCGYPTLLLDGSRRQIPAAPLGVAVAGLPDDVALFYEEARRCATVEGWNAVALLCRTLLMHVAVECKVAKLGDHFEPCVNALDNDGWIPKGGKAWVDHVRKIGNRATHRADHVTKDEATTLLRFVELLLRNVYEAQALLGANAPPSPTP